MSNATALNFSCNCTELSVQLHNCSALVVQRLESVSSPRDRRVQPIRLGASGSEQALTSRATPFRCTALWRLHVLVGVSPRQPGTQNGTLARPARIGRNRSIAASIGHFASTYQGRRKFLLEGDFTLEQGVCNVPSPSQGGGTGSNPVGAANAFAELGAYFFDPSGSWSKAALPVLSRIFRALHPRLPKLLRPR